MNKVRTSAEGTKYSQPRVRAKRNPGLNSQQKTISPERAKSTSEELSAKSSVRISYGNAASNAFTDLREHIEPLLTPGSRVCDIGGGARPLLSVEEVLSYGIEYTVLDISPEELEKASGSLRRVLCDLQEDLDHAADFESAASVPLRGQFDVVFSSTVAEHIGDPRAFHKNIFEMLRPGGYALHLFPTLPTVPFVLNKILPESLSSLLNKLSPVKRQESDKFPAYYRWCVGPTPRAIRRLEELGWEIIEYKGYFGHTYYRRFPPLFRLHEWKTVLLEGHPVPGLTNYALVWLRKPLDAFRGD